MFRDAGAEVIGISADSAVARAVRRAVSPALCAPDRQGGVVRRRYGVAKTLGIFPGRTTYLIDREGVIRHIFSSQFLPTKHVTEALSVLKTLGEGARIAASGSRWTMSCRFAPGSIIAGNVR